VLAVHDVLLKHAWIDDGLVGDGQVDMLRKWLRIVEGQRDVPVLPKVYNTALFNRLLNLPIVFSEYLQTNNPVLNGLGGLATKNSTGLADRVLSQAAEFDPLLKSLLAKKTAINMEKWENEFSKPGLEAVELNQANNRILFSLKLTIKHCQVIQIVQNYFELKDSLVESSNVEPNSQEVHLLAPLNPDTATTNKETSNSNSYLRYLMSKLLLAHVLKSSKNREMQDVLARFRDTVKKDQDTIFKNYEYDHLVAQNVNFCNMAIMLSNQKKPISKKIEAPELVIDQATVNQYLSQAADSSFLFPNKSLLETNLAGVFVELVKSVLEAQVSVYQRASLEIAVRRQKRKQILEPKRKDNLAGNLMGNNESQLLPFLVNFPEQFCGQILQHRDEQRGGVLHNRSRRVPGPDGGITTRERRLHAAHNGGLPRALPVDLHPRGLRARGIARLAAIPETALLVAAAGLPQAGGGPAGREELRRGVRTRPAEQVRPVRGLRRRPGARQAAGGGI
jgi:hypothetical protein